MEPRPEAGLPATLGRWVGEIVLSIRQPARRTVAELIVGGLLAGGGHVTQAFLALTPRLGWQAYHWMLERGRFRLLGLVAALCGIVRREGHGGRCFAIIDDTLAPRASAKAPGAAVRFDHAHKRNRPAFLLCQPQGGWAKQRLLLCTDLDLSAPAVVEAYAQRWSVEPLFAALKLTDGMGAMWQRGRRTLLRWLHLVQIGRALLVLLTARAEPEVLALLRVGGWRRPTTLTPGLVKDALARRFRDIQAFRLVTATHKKTGPARGPGPPVNATTA